MPLSACAPRSSTTNNPETSRCVASLIATVPGAAASCTRAAMLGVSPKTSASVASARANHHRARIDPDSGGELRVPRLFVELRYRVENRQARARRAFGIVVVRRGPAEVGHHAVAQVFRNVAVESRYRFGCGAMVIRATVSRHSSGSSRAAIAVEPTRSQNSTVR